MSEEALQISEKRREAKNKREKERYTHLDVDFQRISRRDKKAFLSDQCREREENNRMDHKKLWKILKEMGIPDHLTCLLRNLYAGQEATVRTGHGTTDWFQIGKGVFQGCALSSAYLTYMWSTS